MAQPQVKQNLELPIENKTAPVVVAKAVIPLNQTRLKEASYVRNEWFVTCPQGTEPHALLQPEFWRNVGQMLKPYDMIEAITEDGAWYAKFIVINASRLWAKVHLVLHCDLTAAKNDMPLTDDQNHEVIWKGPLSKFCVIRKSDSAILKDGFQTQLEGWQWLDGHIKSLAS